MGESEEPRIAPVLGLLAPADPGAAVAIALVRPSAAAFSDLIGGGLLDDALEGACEGGGFAVYLDLEREAKIRPSTAGWRRRSPGSGEVTCGRRPSSVATP